MAGAVLEKAAGYVSEILEYAAAYRGALISILTLIALFIIYKLVTAALKKYLRRKAQKPENIQNFLLVWRYVWLALAAVLALIGFSGSIAGLGLSAAFLGMMLGWSLQAPVTGIAAWLMVILKRPFKIGDRVIIAGIIGDVTDINLTHIVLNQVGGTIGGEEKSGRGVMIPNAILFQQIIYNYAYETSYILDEVLLMITFESDFDEAERICLSAAREVTQQTITETGQAPFIRAEIADSGVRIRLRYQTLGTERQRTSSDIVRAIIRNLGASDKVEFCYPHSEILHRQKPDGILPLRTQSRAGGNADVT